MFKLIRKVIWGIILLVIVVLLINHPEWVKQAFETSKRIVTSEPVQNEAQKAKQNVGKWIQETGDNVRAKMTREELLESEKKQLEELLNKN